MSSRIEAVKSLRFHAWNNRLADPRTDPRSFLIVHLAMHDEVVVESGRVALANGTELAHLEGGLWKLGPLLTETPDKWGNLPHPHWTYRFVAVCFEVNFEVTNAGQFADR